MWWRLERKDYRPNVGSGNKRQLEKLVESRKHAPGILAYSGKQAIGWCSVSPRVEFARLAKARTLKPVDDKPVWSIVCLFVEKDHRRNGVASALLAAAAEYAFSRGATIVEGYPVVPKKERMPDTFAFSGVPAAFEAVGFKLLKRATASRWIMRKEKR